MYVHTGGTYVHTVEMLIPWLYQLAEDAKIIYHLLFTAWATINLSIQDIRCICTLLDN